MGRELSFRAWLESKKGFVHMQLNDKGVFLQSGGILFTTTGWEQYTGLKDKKGKEIYEGDILKHRHIMNPMTGGDFLTVVSYEGFGFNPFIDEYDGNKNIQIKANSYEVIGNIHEHPHLLAV